MSCVTVHQPYRSDLKAFQNTKSNTGGSRWQIQKEKVASQSHWLKPSEDSVYFAHKWSNSGHRKVLDLGAGLGRHSILFAKQGLEVSALDISDYAMNHLNEWAKKENVSIHTTVGDMTELPYKDQSFDCVFVYHAISHSDTPGVKKIIGEIERVLRQGGELYTSMCSKESCEFRQSGFPKIDDNTLLHTEDGPEKNVPHFYADVDDILGLLHNFTIEKIRLVDYCYLNARKQDSNIM